MEAPVREEAAVPARVAGLLGAASRSPAFFAADRSFVAADLAVVEAALTLFAALWAARRAEAGVPTVSTPASGV